MAWARGWENTVDADATCGANAGMAFRRNGNALTFIYCCMTLEALGAEYVDANFLAELNGRSPRRCLGCGSRVLELPTESWPARSTGACWRGWSSGSTRPGWTPRYSRSEYAGPPLASGGPPTLPSLGLTSSLNRLGIAIDD